MSRVGLQRLLGTVFLAGFAAYQIAAFGDFRGWFQPMLSRQAANIFWASQWKMFTHKADRHVEIVYQGRNPGGEWTVLPMHEWYPARWESGYRWDRPAARRYSSIQAQFLYLACEKSGMKQTRMLTHRWKKRMGQMKQPKRGVKKKVLLTWSCNKRPRAPRGRVL